MTIAKRKAIMPTGIDAGACGVRMVQLAHDDGRIQVHRVATWTPTVDDIDATASADQLADRVAQLFKQMEFAKRPSIMALSTPQLELHALDIPINTEQVPQAEVDKAAAWELHRLTTLDQDHVQTAAWILPESRRSKATLMGVAAPTSAVLECLDISTRAGITCERVDVAACALAQLAWRLRAEPKNEVWGILDLGLRHSRVIICVDDVPVLTRTLEFGGHHWTQQIAKALKVSVEAAEQNKLDHGLQWRADSGTAQGRVAEDTPALVLGVLRGSMQRLSLEIERSYEYILQCYSPRVPGALILVGGGAQLGGLPAYLAEQLGINVMPVGSCQSITADQLVRDLDGRANLEVCALACALSYQGAKRHG